MRVVLNNEQQLQSFLFFPSVPKAEPEELQEDDVIKEEGDGGGYGGAQVKTEVPDAVRFSGRKKRKRTVYDRESRRGAKSKKSSSSSNSGKKPKEEVREKDEAEEEEEEEEVSLPSRWSTGRYRKAEMKLIEIVRERGGVRSNPLLRKDLRDEARKHIGDTGLLDHLLKHTAGKIVGDGGDGERFMRRHNADGAMVYWLEPPGMALMGNEIDEGGRRECGAECKEEIGRLKELVGDLSRELEELQSAKDQEKSVWKENYEKLVKRNLKLEANMEGMSSSFKGLMENYERLLKRNVQLEAKIEGMTNSFQGLKGEMMLLKAEKRKEEKKNSKEVEMIEDHICGSDNGICDDMGEMLVLIEEKQKKEEKNVVDQEMIEDAHGGSDNEEGDKKYKNDELHEEHLSVLPEVEGASENGGAGKKIENDKLLEDHLSILAKAKGGSDNSGGDKISDNKLHEHHLSMLPKAFCSSQLCLPYPLPC